MDRKYEMKMRRIAFAMIMPVLMLTLCLDGCQALQEGIRPHQ